MLGALRPPTRPAPARAAVGPASGRLPLEGVKVADFSWIGVGPITAKALADHGATVVHVESDDPADRLRLVGPFKDDVPGINRCQFFGSFNTSKLSLQLDLKHPAGLDVARQLLAWCDVALDSFTAGTMDELGLGYDVARELNPGIIMATTCLLGQNGPAARLAGYGYHAAAISGFYEITGWDDRPPAGPFNAYTDTIAPRFLTTTLLAALDHRRRTGEGQYIDQAQMESALHFLAPELLDVQVSGRQRPAQRQPRPRRCARTTPTRAPAIDEWCAIAVETDEQWRALRAVARRAGVGAWTRRSTPLAGRLAHRADRPRPRRVHGAARAAGADGRCCRPPASRPAWCSGRATTWRTRSSPTARFFRRLEHPEMGEVPYEGHQYRISGYDNGPRFPAPCLGEHTYEVLTEVLGIDVDEVTEILGSGACG